MWYGLKVSSCVYGSAHNIIIYYQIINKKLLQNLKNENNIRNRLLKRRDVQKNNKRENTILKLKKSHFQKIIFSDFEGIVF